MLSTGLGSWSPEWLVACSRTWEDDKGQDVYWCPDVHQEALDWKESQTYDAYVDEDGESTTVPDENNELHELSEDEEDYFPMLEGGGSSRTRVARPWRGATPT